MLLLPIILLAWGPPQTGGVRADSISGQAARALSCGRVVAVSCGGPSSAATLLVAGLGAGSNWRVVIPSEQRHLFGPRIEHRYEDQLVCVAPAAWARAGRELVTVREPGQLVIEDPAQPATVLPEDISRTCDPDVQLPVVVRQVHAPMTADALRAKVDGRLVVRGIVNREGIVGDVQVVQSLEPSQDAAARDALAQWTFRPARRAGEAVPMAITVEMAFTTRSMK